MTAFVLTSLLFSADAKAAEPKPLTKSQAAQILQLMGYEDAEIGAIVQGMGMGFSSQNVATVFAIGRLRGNTEKIETQFFYDAEMGWFNHQFAESPARLRIWSLGGYKECWPKMTLTDAAAADLILGSWSYETNKFTYTKDGRWKQIGRETETGTWKVEKGVLIPVADTIAPAAAESSQQLRILSLDKSAMVLEIKGKDGSKGSIQLSRSSSE